jgi:hypothetical protein
VVALVPVNVPDEAAHLPAAFWDNVVLNLGTMFEGTPCLDWVGYREPWRATKGEPAVERPADGLSYGWIYGPDITTRQRVHLWLFEQMVGPRDPSKVVDHKCHRRQCCNWLHYQEIPKTLNQRRGLDSRLDERYRILHGAGLQRMFSPEPFEITEDPEARRRRFRQQMEDVARQLRLCGEPSRCGTEPLFIT